MSVCVRLLRGAHFAEIIDACKKYGTADRSLWVQALAYFAGNSVLLASSAKYAGREGCKLQISEILQHIDKNNLLPPLMVVDALSHNSTASLSVIKVGAF
jgi:hypothetical protein